MAKKILVILSLLVLTFILGIVFLLLGMTIGGNFFVDFEFMGGRGYEAMGSLGFFIGLGIGLIISIFVTIRLFTKSKGHN